ncbi:hypothetical protein [Mycoplana dimorpha]|uniref:Uncharacterized protein n=1 Tax=Mycoplana dimorpha TaxID=28320 RepID=A0A2T5BAY4_MYCDI|nr:hypothetical protein [Mycoplana dimorpha]PTM96150.1 hypothetical protein C7449_103164 [Mycoplana dimorpha]
MARSARKQNLDAIAQQEQADYLRRTSMTFLECAIHLCVTHMPTKEVVRVLETHACILRDYE